MGQNERAIPIILNRSIILKYRTVIHTFIIYFFFQAFKIVCQLILQIFFWCDKNVPYGIL